jgi:hypothetical protein
MKLKIKEVNNEVPSHQKLFEFQVLCFVCVQFLYVKQAYLYRLKEILS